MYTEFFSRGTFFFAVGGGGGGGGGVERSQCAPLYESLIIHMNLQQWLDGSLSFNCPKEDIYVIQIPMYIHLWFFLSFFLMAASIRQ